MRELQQAKQAEDIAAIEDRDPYAELYQEHGAEVFGFLVKLIGRRSAAEDALQETFVKLLSLSEDAVAGLENPRAWLFAVARRAAIDGLRRERRHRATPLATAESSAVLAALVSPDKSWRELVEDERRSLVAEVLGELELKDQATLLLYARGLSFREMGSVLGCTHPTAKRRFCLAAEALTLALMARRIYAREDL